MASRSVKIRFTHLTHDLTTGKGVRAAEGTQPTLDTDRPHHEAQCWQQLRGMYVPCEGCARHVLDAARAHERRDALEALDARTWVDVAEERVQHRGAANGSVVASLLHLPQAPHAYANLVDARIQTAGCVALRLHAVADLEVLRKAQLHRRSQ